MSELRSPKQQRAHLVRALRVEGRSWVEVAEVLRQRYRVNAQVALRYAHGWSQRQAAGEWNQRWPGELKTFETFSYWEQWPSSTGHAPNFTPGGAATFAVRPALPAYLAEEYATTETMHGGDIDRRNVLKAIGASVALCPLTGQGMGLRELVRNAAHGSAVLHGAIDTSKIEDRTLTEARQDLNRLATDYVAMSGLHHILAELMILRDRLYMLLTTPPPALTCAIGNT